MSRRPANLRTLPRIPARRQLHSRHLQKAKAEKPGVAFS
jgi:hypothetical protein